MRERCELLDLLWCNCNGAVKDPSFPLFFLIIFVYGNGSRGQRDIGSFGVLGNGLLASSSSPLLLFCVYFTQEEEVVWPMGAHSIHGGVSGTDEQITSRRPLFTFGVGPYQCSGM